jgi:hypothetical protein
MVSLNPEVVRITRLQKALRVREAARCLQENGCRLRTPDKMAGEPDSSWHTGNYARGTAAVDVASGDLCNVEAPGFDDEPFSWVRSSRRQELLVSFVDAPAHQILDITAYCRGSGPSSALRERGKAWRYAVRWATLDLSGPSQAAFDAIRPRATQGVGDSSSRPARLPTRSVTGHLIRVSGRKRLLRTAPIVEDTVAGSGGCISSIRRITAIHLAWVGVSVCLRASRHRGHQVHG